MPLRFGDHVLQHTVSANNDFPEQCWCDTLFMAAFLMLRVGVMEHDEELIDDALNQYYWHIKYLQNPAVDSGITAMTILPEIICLASIGEEPMPGQHLPCRR